MPAAVYPHENLEDLLSRLIPGLDAARASGGMTGIPRPIPIIVPAGQFADWLEVRLARLQGVCMGLQFIKPGEFIAQVAALLPQTRGSHLDPWNRDMLLWFILPHIDSVKGELGLPEDRPLSPREAFATAKLLADHFDHYGHSRPELITAWLEGRHAPVSPKSGGSFAEKAEAWQRRLWLRVNEDIQASVHARPHPGHALLQEAEELGRLGAALFPRLFVLGTGGLDPLLVQTLVQLSASGTELEVHVVLPTLHYLGDLRSPSQRSSLLEDPEAEAAAPGHPLVRSLGRQAIGSFLLLGELDENYAHWPEPAQEEQSGAAAGDTLLRMLQRDIATQNDEMGRLAEDTEADGSVAPAGPRNPASEGRGKRSISVSDTSLRLHACHGPRRELEVLRDELLRAFRELPGLRPEEVLVLCADLDTYAPLVHSVLGAGLPTLPLRLTELAAAAGNPLLDALASLLGQAQSRHAATSLLALLKLRAVQNALQVSEDPAALERIQSWIRQSGLTRDFDADERLALELPAEATCTWRFARDRLVSGLLFGPDCPARDQEGRYVLPLAGTLESDTQLRERFIAWFLRLEQIQREWQTPATAGTWSERLEKATQELLAPDEKDNATPELYRQLAVLTEIGSPAELDAGAMEDWVRGQLESQAGSRTQVTGDVCFGRFKQLNHLPCRVLAMVGMQDGKFPRASRTPAWDLLQLEPRRWDRNARIEDRQLFLDALQTPRERLILTASTQNIRSGKLEPFSSCVDELLRAVDQRFSIAEAGGKARAPSASLVVRHRLLPYSPGYFTAVPQEGDRPLPPSLNKHAMEICRSLLEHAAEPVREAPFYSAPGSGLASTQAPSNGQEGAVRITIDELVAFWRDPARGWLEAQGIILGQEEADDTLLDRDPLRLDSLQEWGVRNSILRETLEGRLPAEHTQARLAGDRALPLAELGKGLWNRLYPRAAQLAGTIRALRCESPLGVNLQLRIGGQELELGGSLELAGETPARQLLLYRIGGYSKASHSLEAWIRTVVAACAAGEALGCILLDDSLQPGQPPLLRAGIDPVAARQHLVQLATGLLEGRRAPLCFAASTSAAYARGGAPEPHQELLLEAADGEWYQDSNYSQGEGLARHAQLAWRGLDPFGPERLAAWHSWATLISAEVLKWEETT